MLITRPSSAWAYVLMPPVMGLAAGLGAGLMMLAGGTPIDNATSFGAGVAFVNWTIGAYVTINAIGRERAEYWQWRRSITEQPARETAPAGFAPLAQGYASDVQNHIAPPDPFASLNDKQWRRLAFLVSEGVDNLPYEKLCPKSANGFSRPQWERLRGILLETRNAYASGNQVILNRAGREMIRRRANSPTAGAFR